MGWRKRGTTWDPVHADDVEAELVAAFFGVGNARDLLFVHVQAVRLERRHCVEFLGAHWAFEVLRALQHQRGQQLKFAKPMISRSQEAKSKAAAQASELCGQHARRHLDALETWC